MSSLANSEALFSLEMTLNISFLRKGVLQRISEKNWCPTWSATEVTVTDENYDAIMISECIHKDSLYEELLLELKFLEILGVIRFSKNLTLKLRLFLVAEIICKPS